MSVEHAITLLAFEAMSEVVGSDLIDGFAPWDGRRVPVTLIGGYLGAGKTTTINELLARTERPIAVLVNDVGSVNVDASLISRRHGDTIELTDGCVCCSLNHGLAAAFDQLRRRSEPPDHVVLELSGVADPGPVLPWTQSAGFRLDGVVVLVDADQFLSRIDDPRVGPTVERQLVAADIFILSKTDLAAPDQVQQVSDRLGAIAPGVPIFDSKSTTAAAGFLSIGTRQPGGIADLPEPSLFDVHTTSTIAMPDPIELDELHQLIAGLPADTLRAKGIARDTDGGRHLVQVVGARRVITPLPFAEDQATTDLVVISASE
ncbi:MAG: CobW family GTP-binding protein [Acidimicrobiales bacterium]